MLANWGDFDRAREWLSHFESGLRVGDPLHLAIAGIRGWDAVCTSEKELIESGRQLGSPTNAGLLFLGHGNGLASMRRWREMVPATPRAIGEHQR